MTANQPPDKPQVFRSPTAVVVWVVWLLFAVGNWIDLAVQGRDHASAVAAAILLLATGAAYVTAQRPRIIADKTGVTIRNPLRDHRIGWAGVAKVDLADLLRVHCRWAGPADAAPGQPGGKEHHKVISAWAVHYSRRRQLAAEARARRAARSPGLRRSSLGLPSGGRGLPYGGAVSGPEGSSPGGRSGEDRPGAQRARHRGQSRGRLGQRHHGAGRRRLARRVRAADEHLERPGHRRPRHSRADPAAGLASLAGPAPAWRASRPDARDSVTA